MESTSPTSLLSPSNLAHNKESSHCNKSSSGIVFDSLRQQTKIPDPFVWPLCERTLAFKELDAPVVDLRGFYKGDEAATRRTAEAVRAACVRHGFFQVINHGVGAATSDETLDVTGDFFRLPMATKLKAEKQPGSSWGYARAHADRFVSSLPWKETFTCCYDFCGEDKDGIVGYVTSKLGEEFEPLGRVYERYGEAMKNLSLSIMELLGISLGVGREYYREFFEDGSAIIRFNSYPPCQEPELALGTGPHFDPTAVTILQQDQVGGLEVFTDGEWQSLSPVRDAFVINIGDTFVALSNEQYKSCLHRAVVNRDSDRRSIAFFTVPSDSKVVRPPKELLLESGRAFPDFLWRELLEFTQTQYRVDTMTLKNFFTSSPNCRR